MSMVAFVFLTLLSLSGSGHLRRWRHRNHGLALSGFFPPGRVTCHLMPLRCGRSRTLSAKPKIPSIFKKKIHGETRYLPLADLKTEQLLQMIGTGHQPQT